MVSVWDPVCALLSLLQLAGPLLSTPVIQQGMPLGGMIRYSEPARYDANSLRLQQHRLRRSALDTAPSQHITLNFTAHNRDFRLHLRPDTSVFAQDVEFEGTNGPIHYDTSRAFVGSLEGDDVAVVHGVVTSDGLFDGTISTPSEHYHVEPAQRYLRDAPFHSVIYRASDVDAPDLNPEGCASERLRRRQQQLHQQQQREPRPGPGPGPGADRQRLQRRGRRVKRWWVHRPRQPAPPQLGLGLGLGLDSSDESLSDLSAHSPLSRGNTTYNTYHPPRNVDFVISTSPNHNFRDTSSLEDFVEPYNTYHLNKHHKSLPFPPFPGPDLPVGGPPGAESNSVHVNKSGESDRDRGPEIIPPENTSNKIVLYNHTILIRTRTPNDDSSGSSNQIERSDPEVVPYNKVLSSFFLPDEDPRHFHKRATIDPKKTTCMLYLQADHLFYQKYGTEEACIEVMTRHVQRVNAIYRTTDFNQDGKADNISFMIKRIKVHSSEALRDPSYRFPDNYGVEKFLELFSEEDYDAFCLAYMFTYRDFEMGTLGLAWTGDLKNAGGVCEKNGHYRGSLKSLNTGIVTLLNYGKHVPPAVSHVTLAHEIGHNFGSPHDPELCTPGGEDGNFIMFARATSGDKKNNNHFSPCSLNSINPVLNAKARSAKGCFTEPQTAICGNGVVEPGEECDCGWEEDCRDRCCFPQRRYPPPGEPPCRLTPNSMCSPSQGPCCTSECNLKFGDKCRDDNGCRDSSYCDGRGPQCPPSVNKPNKTICNDEFVCFMGECTGSICLAYGLESCQCIPGPDDLPTKACELCCKLPGDQNPCKSSFHWNKPPYDVPDMFSKPGTPCNDYNGYCDVFQKCREVDPSGPLATLRKLLLSEESIASFKRWLADNWYFVLLIAVVVLALLVMSTKYLAKRPDPKLLAVTIIHSSTTETVRLPGEGGGTGAGGPPTIVHPSAARKLPFKRRVRLDRRRRKDGRNKTAPAPATALAAAPQPVLVAAPVSGSTSTPAAPSAPPAPVPVPAPAPASPPAAAAAASLAVPTPSAPPAAPAGAAARSKKAPAKKAAPDGETLAERGAAELLPHAVRKPAGRKQGPSTKLNVKKAQKRAKKEVIDYSAKQSDQDKMLSSGGASASPLALTPSDDPMGKVHNWLLSSQLQAEVPGAGSGAPLPSPTLVPKSKSSPAALTESPHRRSLVQPSGRLDADKVRLQVLYKTPFKFRLKLKGSSPSGVTTKLSADRVRKVPAAEEKQPASKKVVGGIAGPRTAMLVRTRESGANHRRSRRTDSCQPPSPPPPVLPPPVPVSRECPPTPPRDPDIDSNIHTVPSDLEGLLSEVEPEASGRKA